LTQKKIQKRDATADKDYMDTAEELCHRLANSSPSLPATDGVSPVPLPLVLPEPAIINSKRVGHVHGRGISFPMFVACVVVSA
jgi:hypothetical protein